MSKSEWKSCTKDELIIEVWEALDCESVGEKELSQIQQALQEKFGAGGVESPASIARTVADEGAVLRHPEVFECDRIWRKEKLAERGLAGKLNFSNLVTALESFATVEERRVKLQANGDEKGTEQLREMVLAARKDSQLRARSKIIDNFERKQASEIAEWLRVWLQAPALFNDWLDLRRRSKEYRKNFAEADANLPN